MYRVKKRNGVEGCDMSFVWAGGIAGGKPAYDHPNARKVAHSVSDIRKSTLSSIACAGIDLPRLVLCIYLGRHT